jgi:hypothetical protein
MVLHSPLFRLSPSYVVPKELLGGCSLGRPGDGEKGKKMDDGVVGDGIYLR